MTKTIDTLVADIYEVLNGNGGWDATITEFMSDEMALVLRQRFEHHEHTREPTLRMSNLGSPCLRKLWYSLHHPNEGETFSGQTRFKFLYGDVIELLLVGLARAAGHTVEGSQDELSIAGIKGHRDCVIDGVTVDIKSASPYSFTKFANGELRSDDPFGYISQLSSYVYAGREHAVDSHPTVGAFLVANKVSGELCLDKYDFGAEIDTKEEDVEHIKTVCNNPDVTPPRAFEPEVDGYKNKARVFVPNGNKKLGVNCSYCEFKNKCYPRLRTFMYRRGQGFAPTFFTHIAKEPKVQEIT
jgi:hypothetical protein